MSIVDLKRDLWELYYYLFIYLGQWLGRKHGRHNNYIDTPLAMLWALSGKWPLLIAWHSAWTKIAMRISFQEWHKIKHGTWIGKSGFKDARNNYNNGPVSKKSFGIDGYKVRYFHAKNTLQETGLDRIWWEIYLDILVL